MLETLRSGQLSLGPMIDRFEAALAERVGAPYVAAVSSGTAGLHLCMRLAGIGPGDEVVTTPFSFVASANCALYEGATPVFADIDPRTLNLDPAAGRGGDHAADEGDPAGAHLRLPGRARRAARRSPTRHGLAVVEDACEALGSEYRGRPVGSSGHPAVFAFYPNKQMTTGEGGAVAVASEEEWALLKSLSNQGRSDAATGSRTRGSATTTASTTSPPRSAWPSSSGSTRSWRRGARWRRATASCSPRVDGVEAPLARRRRPPPLLVRLRGRAGAGATGTG